MSAPIRVQLSRKKGYRKPENTVVVARPSRWGNPFRAAVGTVFGPSWGEVRDYPIGTRFPKHDEYAVYSSHSDPATAVQAAVGLFRTYAVVTRRDFPEEFEAWIAPLRGRDLACWCRPGQACHVDVLLELANGGER
ncbi:DUF4326 domain-containing protein [Microbacterium maritypicum]|uniref:DUF4326 domain-containing protein n=1 Tax=Microbacterium maritypicum TaxID=33918 RepID=UPI003D6F0EE5